MTQAGQGLLVVDMQVAMFDPADPVHDGARLLATVGSLVSRARASEVPVIYVRQDGRPGSGLGPGERGNDIHPDVAPRAGEPVVGKTTPDSFHNTALDVVLSGLAVRKLLVCGIQTDLCVDTTCRRAASLGYDVVLVRDAHSTWPRLELTAEQIIAHHNDILCDWFATGATAADLF